MPSARPGASAARGASLYVCRPSATDPTSRRPGHENLFVLVPVPADPASATAASTAPGDRRSSAIADARDRADRRSGPASRTSRRGSRCAAPSGPPTSSTTSNAWQGTRARAGAHPRARARCSAPGNVEHEGRGAATSPAAPTIPGIGLPMCLISAELVLKRLRGDTTAGPLPEPVRAARRHRMNGLYLAALCVSIAGLLVLDARLRLFVFAAPLRALAVLVVGVAGFLLWDVAGIRLGIFFEGNRALLTGVDLAPRPAARGGLLPRAALPDRDGGRRVRGTAAHREGAAVTTYAVLALGVLLPVAVVSLVVLVRAGRVVLPVRPRVGRGAARRHRGVRLRDRRHRASSPTTAPASSGSGSGRRRSRTSPTRSPPAWRSRRSGGCCGPADGRDVLRQLLIASRPLSWVNTAYPFALALLLLQRPVEPLLLVVGTLYFLIPYNLAMYGINDVFDYESDLRNPRKGGVEGAVLDPRFHRPILIAVVVVNVPFLVALVLLGGSRLVARARDLGVRGRGVQRAAGCGSRSARCSTPITSSTHFVSPAVYAVALAGRAARRPDRAAARRVLLLGDGEPRVRRGAGHPGRPRGGHRVGRDGLRGAGDRRPRVRPLRRRGRARRALRVADGARGGRRAAVPRDVRRPSSASTTPTRRRPTAGGGGSSPSTTAPGSS